MPQTNRKKHISSTYTCAHTFYLILRKIIIIITDVDGDRINSDATESKGTQSFSYFKRKFSRPIQTRKTAKINFLEIRKLKIKNKNKLQRREKISVDVKL